MTIREIEKLIVSREIDSLSNGYWYGLHGLEYNAELLLSDASGINIVLEAFLKTLKLFELELQSCTSNKSKEDNNASIAKAELLLNRLISVSPKRSELIKRLTDKLYLLQMKYQ